MSVSFRGNIRCSSPRPEGSMSICELESIKQNQHEILSQLASFVRDGALHTHLDSVEKEIFRLGLLLGKAFLEEVIARHGTGKVAEVVDDRGERLPYQGVKKTTYLSIFGEVGIWLAY